MLIVETGEIVTGAESYVSVAECDTYHANRANTDWAGEEALKEAALRKAATFLDGEYRRRWKGYRVQPLTQALEWPRCSVQVDTEMYRASYDHDGYLSAVCLPSDSIPQRLKDAQCELALRALSGDLAKDAGARVKVKRVDIITTEYFNGEDASKTRYLIVEQLLSDLLKPVGSCDVLRG